MSKIEIKQVTLIDSVPGSTEPFISASNGKYLVRPPKMPRELKESSIKLNLSDLKDIKLKFSRCELDHKELLVLMDAMVSNKKIDTITSYIVPKAIAVKEVNKTKTKTTTPTKVKEVKYLFKEESGPYLISKSGNAYKSTDFEVKDFTSSEELVGKKKTNSWYNTYNLTFRGTSLGISTSDKSTLLGYLKTLILFIDECNKIN
jgi:hypothetical protein